MKEFIEKLIGRLEEEKGNWNGAYNIGNYRIPLIRVKEIINELAEEYNNGWIPCSERLPETYEYVLVWCNGRFIEGPCIGEECQWYGIGVLYGKVWTVYQCKDIKDIKVIAWQSLPAPYKKGCE
jgi:hypothetical protein